MHNEIKKNLKAENQGEEDKETKICSCKSKSSKEGALELREGRKIEEIAVNDFYLYLQHNKYNM